MNFLENTRGFRNNNPGNIRIGIDWKGETKGADVSFETFTSVEYGIRAIFKLIDTYSKKYGINTVRGVISRYAPSSENATDMYIQSVVAYMLSQSSGIKLNIIQESKENTLLNDFEIRSLLVAGIIKHENGFQPFNIKFIEGCANL